MRRFNTEGPVRPDRHYCIPPLARLDDAFQTFFREHSEHWLGRFDYQEAGPQLLLQAYLQRIVNGAGVSTTRKPARWP